MRILSLFIALTVACGCYAKEIRTVVLKTNPVMHCTGCEKKIKEFIRFEKGIKDIKTDLVEKTVTIQYDSGKTSVKKIIKAFKKIKYEATEADAKVTDGAGKTEYKSDVTPINK